MTGALGALGQNGFFWQPFLNNGENERVDEEKVGMKSGRSIASRLGWIFLVEKDRCFFSLSILNERLKAYIHGICSYMYQ